MTDTATALKTEVTTDPTLPTFADFDLPERLQQALARMDFVNPTPVQSQAIPLAMAGKDILGSAQTGTGKTGAFGIPLVAKLMENPTMTALVMTPTRELATQVMAMLQQLIPVAGIKTALLIGGEPMPKQFMQLKNVPRLVVGTPGRINDHLVRGTLKLHRTGFLVLDETDRMLDMGFSVQIDEIAKHLPEARQTLLFSATLPSNIVKLSSRYLRNPERITVGSTTTPGKHIKQEIIAVNESDKYAALLDQLNNRDGSVIIFVKTKHGTERLADKLCNMDFRADAIHGDLQQRKRDRVIMNFREKKFNILVATDVAARGLDIPHIETVINYDLPQVPEDYIHRIGRTGRNGAVGEAVNLLTPADKMKWRAIQSLMDPNSKEQHRDEPRQRSGGSSFGGKKPFGAKPSFGGQRRDDRPAFGANRPNREGAGAFDRREGRPSFGDRPQRSERPSYDDRPQRSERPSYNDRPQRAEGDRPSYNDRPQRSEGRPSFGDRPQRAEGGRPSFNDRAPRAEGGRPSFDRRPSFGDRAPRGEAGPFDRREKRPFADRTPPRSEGGRPSFGDRPQRAEGSRPFGDRPQRSEGGNKPFGRPAGGAKPFGAKKPFGKPAGRRFNNAA